MTQEQADTMISLLTEIRDALTIGGAVEQQLQSSNDKIDDVVHQLKLMDITLSSLG